MTKKNFLHFVLGLSVSTIISLGGYFLIFIHSFDLFGTRQAKDPEGFDGEIFYLTLILVMINCFVSIFLITKKRRFSAAGSSAPLILGFTILIWFGKDYFNKSTYYESFDRVQWTANTNRVKMARKLVKEEELLGLSKDDVTQKLGQGFETTDNDRPVLLYNVDGDWMKLALLFERDKVSEADIWVYD